MLITSAANIELTNNNMCNMHFIVFIREFPRCGINFSLSYPMNNIYAVYQLKL